MATVRISETGEVNIIRISASGKCINKLILNFIIIDVKFPAGINI
jgi:hypothetical protein